MAMKTNSFKDEPRVNYGTQQTQINRLKSRITMDYQNFVIMIVNQIKTWVVVNQLSNNYNESRNQFEQNRQIENQLKKCFIRIIGWITLKKNQFWFFSQQPGNKINQLISQLT
ncbi:hypothetical protein ABPG72_013589 [Tetrahymena utriculariae]